MWNSRCSGEMRRYLGDIHGLHGGRLVRLWAAHRIQDWLPGQVAIEPDRPMVDPGSGDGSAVFPGRPDVWDPALCKGMNTRGLPLAIAPSTPFLIMAAARDSTVPIIKNDVQLFSFINFLIMEYVSKNLFAV